MVGAAAAVDFCQAAFVDDILSLVALTMLLQIGVAESTGEDLSLWRVAKPLVFSVLFCVGGALMGNLR